jgi:exodeoxyribonuclease VII large subunit
MALSFQLALTDEVWTVSRLTTAIHKAVEREIKPLWVRGEMVQCKVAPSGHWYFTLRDAESQIRCTMWKLNAQQSGRPPKDGTDVFALGRPEVYLPKGELQLKVSRVIPTTALGMAQQELERVRAILQQDGLFDVARKRRLPQLACTIAVVTSRAGAALHDIVTVTRKRWPCTRLLVVDARVQGEGAVEDLVRALRWVNRLPGIEVCIVGRGGGAREDLAAFNSEAVCRALAAVRVPTISAVGHETDVSLTDLIADFRAPTPSAAAELAVADQREVLRQVNDLASRLSSGLGGRGRLVEERLARSADRLQAAMQVILQRRQHRADRLGAQLDALSPLRILERGFALPLAPDGRVLKRRAEFIPGESFRLRVADGDVGARVE